MEKQKTIAKAVTIKGQGLHTGAQVEVTITPAAEDSGIKFKRTDIDKQPVILAVAENVVDTSRGTTIGKGEATLSTIEHMMAALMGCDIDNALIEVNAPEMPIFDGSANEYVKAILSAGTEEQEAEREYFEVTQKMTFKDEERGVDITIYPEEEFSVDVHIDYNSDVVGHQFATLSNLSDFPKEIAPCRTFVFLHELEQLAKNNLIKGGDLNTALVIVDRDVSTEERDHLAELFNKPKIELKKGDYINIPFLHFDNELARHKLLDVVGDLALTGKRIKGRVIANRPGHLANTELAKELRKLVKKSAGKPVPPKYDPNSTPLYEINGIKKLLPHRYPFLLIDRIFDLSSEMVCGIKNVTLNEPFFQGHFPHEPIMPGVLIVEAMAQIGGILALNTVEDPENYLTYFLKIDNVKFKRMVVPGDQLIFRLSLTEPVRRGIFQMKGEAFVGDTLATEGDLMAQIVKVK